MSDQFLRIIDNERRVGVRHVAMGSGLALVLLFMANLADDTLYGGLESFTYVVTLFLGIMGGVAYGWWRAKRVGASLKSAWNTWMRFSVSSATLDEVYRKTVNKTPRPPVLVALGATGLFLANVLLFYLLWHETPNANAFALLMVIVNGAYAGGWIGLSAYRFGWAHAFNRALEDLVKDGTIGVWGER